MGDPGNGPTSLPAVPWSRLALAYALGLTLLEIVAIAAAPPALVRSLLVGDAVVGWLVVLASWQGVRAMPWPPPRRAVVVSALATGHWLAAVLGALVAIAQIAAR